jgi:spore germination cell wall hydrolase CwlJ-like protein
MTDLELRIYAATVRGEAEGEGRDGMAAVAWVLKHRVARRQRGVVEICFEPLQFSIWNGDSRRRAEILQDTGPIHREAAAVCLDVWDGREPDITDRADHYFADYIDPPAWAATMLHTVTIGHHLFYDSQRRPA